MHSSIAIVMKSYSPSNNLLLVANKEFPILDTSEQSSYNNLLPLTSQLGTTLSNPTFTLKQFEASHPLSVSSLGHILGLSIIVFIDTYNFHNILQPRFASLFLNLAPH